MWVAGGFSSVALVVIAASTFAAINDVDSLGCTEGDLDLAASLESEPVLGAHPASAKLRESHAECDDDDRLISVERSYISGARRSETIAFYKNAARESGWRLEVDHHLDRPYFEDSGQPALCFSKDHQGQEVYLNLLFESEFGAASTTDYAVAIEASATGMAWCDDPR